jgi:hypothetical protein
MDVSDMPDEGRSFEQEVEGRKAEQDFMNRQHLQTLPDNFHVAVMRHCLMPTVAEARARLAELERERAQLRAFIRNEERIAKKHPTGPLKGME